ncbi:MAG: GtrA family protein [Coriobacteriia bacterium]|nr:GtrA family protein [Coriobacteriia bacterium]
MSERVGSGARLRAYAALHEEKLRFLVVGGWNTLFSYGMLWVLDAFLHARLHYSLILTVNWIIGVTHNLFTFKLLVFRTRGNWLKEYLRSYVVYAGSFALNLAIVAVIMELWAPRLVIAQLPAIVVVTIISYLGHKHFTYRTTAESAQDARP